MMNTLMTCRRAAFQVAVKSSTKTSALLSRPCLVYLGRRFSAQMQMDDSDNETRPPKNKKDQLMAGYSEYLDKMMEKTNKIESSMQALRETYAQKKQCVAGTTIKWTDASDIDRLFDESGQHKEDISTELSELKSILQDARQDAYSYHGVDAPDGESDWHVHEEMQEIKTIIDYASVLEDKEEVMQRREMEAEAAKKIFAVDAPDGESDGYVKEHIKEEMQEIKNIIDDAAVLEDKDEVMQRRKMEAEAAKIFAVDAPDGESDGYVKEHIKDEMQEIKNIIDDAAVLEDKDEIMQRHKMEADAAGIYAVDAPDGDSDGHVQEELHEVQHIIDDASELKNKTSINRKHKM